MSVSYSRWQENIILEALSSRRILLLAGARQCGKTTLAKSMAVDGNIYHTLDDLSIYKAALEDPQGFVHHDNQLMIINEIQRVPSLLTAIKQNVDENTQPGRFLLIGSANIQSLPGVNESLAGRVRKIRLRPLAMGEIHGRAPNFVRQAFAGKFSNNQPLIKERYNKDSYLADALAGGYPEPRILKNEKEKRRWYKDYLDALIERDLKDITKIHHTDSMKKLVEILAAWSSKFMDIASICKMLTISRPTLVNYINALEALYLVERVRPWHKTDYDRVGKQEKIFVTDSGLMGAVLRLRLEDIRLNGEVNGKLIETFVFNQLAAILDADEDIYQLYHYRDGEKREVDFIIEHDNGDILGIEVKAGSAVSGDSFKHMRWFRDNIIPDRKFIGVVLYTGENILPFGENLWAVPMREMWA